MAVLTTESGSVLGAFLPKPRATTRTVPAPRAARRSLRAWAGEHARQIKDGIVSTAAFASGTVAAFQWHPWAGFVSIGVSLLLIDHSVDRKPAGGDAG